MCDIVGKKSRGMTMLSPATDWRDALPCGNGKIGALVYGDVANERIVINSEELYYGGILGEVPDMSSCLPELRSLLLQGSYAVASKLYPEKMRQAGFDSKLPDFHPAFDFIIKSNANFYSNYLRNLNFETGEATVSWYQGGKKYNRRSFVSLADDVIVLSISTDSPEGLDVTLSLRKHDFSDAVRSNGDMFTPPIDFEYNARDNKLFLCGFGSDGGDFGGMARIITEGVVDTSDDSVRVYDTSDILIIIGVFSGESSKISYKKIESRLNGVESNYDSLLCRHVVLHEGVFSRVKLDIGDQFDMNIPNERLLQEASVSLSTELLVRMFDYGRYLLLCSSNNGSLPSNLQGIWNGDYQPAWNSCFINNENIQMTYWQALPCNMPETIFPYFDYYESRIEDFRENARKMWGCRGIFIPLNTAHDSGLLRDIQSHVICWTGAAGWISQLFYDYWLFTGDKDFLFKRAVPFMKEVASFYEDFIIEDKQGFNMFCPSNSPENAPNVDQVAKDENGNTIMNPGIAMAINSTVDFAIAKEVLSNLCNACEVLGIEKESVTRWKRILGKMPEYQTNGDGVLKEWMYPGLKDNYHHRHISHLYPLFPGYEITQESSPDLFNACADAVEKRLTIGLKEQTGWSLSHMANVYARLEKSDRALECLELLSKSCVGKNLFTYHNDWRNSGITLDFIYGKSAPFQIDANMGWTSAVIEMLLFSSPEIIKVLPALPKVWDTGSFEGFLCRNGVKVDVQWNQKSGFLKVRFHSKHQTQFSVKFPGSIRSMQCSSPESIHSTGLGSCYCSLNIPANRRIEMVLDLDFRDNVGQKTSKPEQTAAITIVEVPSKPRRQERVISQK